MTVIKFYPRTPTRKIAKNIDIDVTSSGANGGLTCKMNMLIIISTLENPGSQTFRESIFLNYSTVKHRFIKSLITIMGVDIVCWMLTPIFIMFVNSLELGRKIFSLVKLLPILRQFRHNFEAISDYRSAIKSLLFGQRTASVSHVTSGREKYTSKNKHEL
ncbi:hypothetical protein PRIPAC_77081 [Pristionchus pacificus]|uniref:Uncharacterized protein n=1 Tax=Pristionchus pacificus TaxID=54126 RepID=A0A2A6CMN2_PRIPA|nr:hypothetical protein PRIPAC_77081 [Pristionchus pacificus]|eukprot:PDM79358.1 hypothetical protein PRIPAC_31937 [Pristionchus pacificus]